MGIQQLKLCIAGPPNTIRASGQDQIAHHQIWATQLAPPSVSIDTTTLNSGTTPINKAC